ncbi:MAG: MBL fold metallo-hydrolase [Planctomycetota bacterium]|nr:MBL fold metallo-hydrolase [Planctomycetota bacterium]
MLWIVIAIMAVLIAGAGALLCHPMFGKLPSGERLKRIQKSPNHRDGAFVNRVPKPHMVEGASPLKMGWEFLFKRKNRLRPAARIPARKTDFASLPPDRDAVIWFGHSSLFLQIGGKKFLVDPNFTPYASPFFWRTYSFPGTDLYSPDEIPFIDCLLITHDHFDHLNYDTITAIKDKIGLVVCGLGVGEHLEYWGIPAEKINETDWGDFTTLSEGLVLHTLPTHHFSGRTLWKRNPSIWASFVLETPTRQLYLGGDSGYGEHFADIGKRFGPFDLAFLENGQYDPNWKHNHLFPEETLLAARELRAARVFPIHAGRFVLANHPWSDPYIRIAELAGNGGMELVTPVIGETVFLDELDKPEKTFANWWEGIE